MKNAVMLQPETHVHLVCDSCLKLTIYLLLAALHVPSCLCNISAFLPHYKSSDASPWLPTIWIPSDTCSLACLQELGNGGHHKHTRLLTSRLSFLPLCFNMGRHDQLSLIAEIPSNANANAQLIWYRGWTQHRDHLTSSLALPSVSENPFV